MTQYILIFLFFMVFITPGHNQNPLIIGHRGSSYTMPENTVIAAVKAWEEGADAVEIDVYPTADGEIAVIHDKSTKRTTGKDYLVSKTNSKILTSLDAGMWKDPQFKGEHLPLLPEVINVIPRYKQLVIEVKSGIEIIPLLEKMLDGHAKRKNIIFIAFGWDVIKGLKETFPDLPCFWLSADISDVHSKWEEVVSSGLDGINLYYKIIDRDLIELTHNNNLGIMCWTVDEMDDVNHLIDIGIDGITTNRPGFVRQQLLEKMDLGQ